MDDDNAVTKEFESMLLHTKGVEQLVNIERGQAPSVNFDLQPGFFRQYPSASDEQKGNPQTVQFSTFFARRVLAMLLGEYHGKTNISVEDIHTIFDRTLSEMSIAEMQLSSITEKNEWETQQDHLSNIVADSLQNKDLRKPVTLPDEIIGLLYNRLIADVTVISMLKTSMDLSPS